MDIKATLLKEHSKHNTLRVVAYIGNDKVRFKELIDVFMGDNMRATQGAAWALSFCCDHNSDLLSPYVEELILNLKNDIPVAVKRNTVRILQLIEIPASFFGETVDICFKLLNSKEEPIAVKVFSMTVLFNIVKKVPELKEELKISIEDQLPYGSAGFKARGKKILLSLSKLQ